MAHNQLMHCEFHADSLHANSIYYQLIAFLMEFYEHHFDRPSREEIPDDLWNRVIEMEDFINNARARIKEKIDRSDIDYFYVWNCRNCGNEAFVVHNEENTCYLCGYTDEVIYAKIVMKWTTWRWSLEDAVQKETCKGNPRLRPQQAI